jgi:hypothetical protein
MRVPLFYGKQFLSVVNFYFAGVVTLTSIFLVPPPSNPLPNTKNKATIMITKITSTATTPVLPPPPPLSSPIELILLQEFWDRESNLD